MCTFFYSCAQEIQTERTTEIGVTEEYFIVWNKFEVYDA
jgi:hypothetical protein